MILSGQSIRKRCLQEGMLYPFHERGVVGGMSFGLSIAGYDIRVAEHHVLQPGDFVLASSVERFAMPDDLIAFVHDKSTWARKGLATQNTIIEPGWCGFLTLELTNHSNDIIIIKEGMPIAQIVFQLLDMPAEKPYDGKYQHQKAGPQAAKYE